MQLKSLTAFLTFIILAAMLVGCTGSKGAIFPDENLEEAVRDALFKSEGEEITVAELSNLTILWADGYGITDLSGLEYCTGLRQLQINGNQISDISPLRNLTNLVSLSALGNQISDISPLENLTNLTSLGLSVNQISDITPLENLTNLTSLGLWENQISDISPLKNLIRLERLAIHANQISDISPLVENIGLGSGDEVKLDDNNVDLREGSDDMDNIRALERRGVVVYY